VGTITVNQGVVRLIEDSGSHFLTAEEIYSVVFEGAVLLRGVAVSRDNFLSTGLEFCEYAADPMVVLQAAPPDRPSTIACHFIAKGNGFEAGGEGRWQLWTMPLTIKRGYPSRMDQLKPQTDF
jgi:hypothetical protein